MRLVLGQDKAVTEWVIAHIPHVDDLGKSAAIGVTDDYGAILGGVVFHEYRGNDIQMSCAAQCKRWLDRGVLRALFSYPFDQLKVDRVTAMTPAGNTGTRRFLERAGFKQEGVMRQGFKGDDCIIYGMLRNECKWIEG